MKKRFNPLVITILLVSIFVLFNVFFMNSVVFNFFPNNKVIIIDAGHGGLDGGAVGKQGTIEKDINLSIAKKLKGYIESHGDTAVMIREVDEGLYSEQGSVRNKKNEDLKNRKEIIKNNNADIFVSIHLNSFPQSQYYGAQVFFCSNCDGSEKLGKLVQASLIDVLDKNNKRVAKPASTYYLLRENPIPSVIVECGFLSNPSEEILLRDEKYQNKIAWAIYCGINRYFESK